MEGVFRIVSPYICGVCLAPCFSGENVRICGVFLQRSSEPPPGSRNFDLRGGLGMDENKGERRSGLAVDCDKNRIGEVS